MTTPPKSVFDQPDAAPLTPRRAAAGIRASAATTAGSSAIHAGSRRCSSPKCGSGSRYYGIRPLLVALHDRRARAAAAFGFDRTHGVVHRRHLRGDRLPRVAARRLDRRPLARTAPRDLVRRGAHRARPPLDRVCRRLGRPSVLPRTHPHRASAPVCSSRTSRPSSAISIPKAARDATRAFRSSTWASTPAPSSARSSPAPWASASAGTAASAPPASACSSD